MSVIFGTQGGTESHLAVWTHGYNESLFFFYSYLLSEAELIAIHVKIRKDAISTWGVFFFAAQWTHYVVPTFFCFKLAGNSIEQWTLIKGSGGIPNNN